MNKTERIIICVLSWLCFPISFTAFVFTGIIYLLTAPYATVGDTWDIFCQIYFLKETE